MEPTMWKQMPQFTVLNGHYRKGDVMDLVNDFIVDTGAKIKISKHTRKAIVSTGSQALFMSYALRDFFGYEFKPSSFKAGC